jgi:hypothetical protein
VCFFCEAPFSEKFSLYFFYTIAKKLAPKKFLCFATKKKSLDSALFVSVLLRFFLLNKKEEEEEQSVVQKTTERRRRERV